MDRDTLHKILAVAMKAEASDIHLKVNTSILLRVNGVLQEAKTPPLSGDDTRAVAAAIVEGAHPPVDLDQIREWDGSYSINGVGRFRVNIFKQRNSFAVILRVIPFQVPTLETLGLPPVLEQIASEERGLVLVTGVTGSGKTSTLAALIDYLNETQHCHILTIEDPIEYIHKNKKSSMSQREIGLDTSSFNVALRAALRQDPDIILVGEMRDTETMSTALTAAETGHLVFATLHTQDAPQTIDRIIDVFPPYQQDQIRVQLSTTLMGVCTQQLLPTADGRGRVVACELLVPTPAVRNLVREGKTHQIYSVMQTGTQHGMQTMDAALSDLVRRGQITRELALRRSSTPEDLKRLLGQPAMAGVAAGR